MKKHSFLNSPPASSLLQDAQACARNGSNLVLFFGVFLLAAFVHSSAYAVPGLPGLGGNNANTCSISTIGFSNNGINFGIGINPVCTLFEGVYQAMSGLTGKALATLAVMAVGAAALFGKVSWPTALITVFGVGLVFGAGSLIAVQGANLQINLTSFFGAMDTDPIAAVLVELSEAMQGEAARAIGIVACVIIGIGALFGKVTWLQCLLWVTGIGMIYGATDIVQNLFVINTNAGDVAAMASVAATDPIASSFMNIVLMFTSTTGIAIGTIGVLACGFAALIGKLTWPRAMMLGAGLALMYGACDIVYILMGPLNPCNGGQGAASLGGLGATLNSDPFTQVLCGFMDELQGPVGQTIGTLAVMILGVLAIMGKISWEMGFVVATGIALIFGADAIINLFQTSLNGVTCGTTAPTFTSTSNAIADVLCYIVMIIYGPAGKALATIAVSMLGFGALMGKVSFSQAFVVAIGIAVCFGAPTLVQDLLPAADLTGCPAAVGNGLGLGGLGGYVPC